MLKMISPNSVYSDWNWRKPRAWEINTIEGM